MTKDEVLVFIKQHKIAVIATAGEEYPESAVVDFIISDNFEIVFNTYIGSRKYRNLGRDKHVSFVIGWDNATVQYEGTAVELSEDALEDVQKDHAKNFKYIRLWKEKEMSYFRVHPKWVKYTDFSSDSQETFEIEF